MWYPNSNIKPTDSRGLEEKILAGDAEYAIRRRLLAICDYNPEQEEITRLTKQVMKQILDKYGNFNLVRHNVSGESLSPIINDIVKGIVKLKM